MKFSDYSPPSSPSFDQQRDALRKGLGRAVQWASLGRLDEELLLTACLHDQCYDTQVADERGEWLWRLIQSVGAVDRFRTPILHALNGLPESCNANQLCVLARCYAQAGDSAFRTRLYEIVETNPIADSPRLGEEEIIALDGERGFLFAVKIRGQALATSDWDCDDFQLVEHAVEQFSDDAVRKMLNDSTDEAIGRFATAWQKEKTHLVERAPVRSHREHMRAIPVAEIIAAAESGNAGYGLFRSWGTSADPADLQTVLRHLWAADEPKVIANLASIFCNRALPEFDTRLIELCRHSDAEVRRRAVGALSKNTHPMIREFAVAELANGLPDAGMVCLFTHNFEPGDEQRILDAITLPADEDELHGLLMDITRVLEKNTNADCSQLGVVTYALTPCKNCQFFAMRLLANQQVVPDWMSAECRYDSAEDCRKLFETKTESMETG